VADRPAKRNGMCAVTDEPRLYAALSGWTDDTLAQVLLGDADLTLDPGAEAPAAPATPVEEVGRLFTVVAFDAVPSAGHDDVPLEKVLAARREPGPELYAYQRHLETFAGRFAELSTVGGPAVLREHLGVTAEGEIEPQAAELAHRLRLLGFQPPAEGARHEGARAGGGDGSGVRLVGGAPLVSASGAVAACLVGAAADARQQACEAAASPTTYLVGLKEHFSPRGAVSLTRALLRRRHTVPPSPERPAGLSRRPHASGW
jgi:hypothetical protein